VAAGPKERMEDNSKELIAKDCAYVP